MRQEHATRILVMTIHDIIDSEIGNGCLGMHGRTGRYSFGQTGSIFPNLWFVGRTVGGLPYDSALARFKCQSPPVEQMRKIDRDLVCCLNLATSAGGRPGGWGEPKDRTNSRDHAIGQDVWGCWVETSRQSRMSHKEKQGV